MTPVPSDSEILEHHYNYELDMLANTYRLLEDHRIQQNALIESFCLHARNLIEFLCDKNKGQQYTENYIPFAKNKTSIGKLNQLINQQISHLDVKKRTAKDSDKISDKNRSELTTILSAETVEFRKHLKQSYRGMSISVLMHQQNSYGSAGIGSKISGLASSGATTTTTSAIGISTGATTGI